MKEEEKNNKSEKPISPEEISKIDPYTISKIILLDGTVLSVQNNSSIIKDSSLNQLKNNDYGATNNLKSNKIPNSNQKPKNSFSYIEWDFPKSKNRNNSYQRNIDNELKESKTEQKESNNNNREYSRDSAFNKNRKSKNYSYYESKHISKKVNNLSNTTSKNNSASPMKDNHNIKEINNKDNNTEKKGIEENNNKINNNLFKANLNKEEIKIEKKEEIKNVNEKSNKSPHKQIKKEEVNNRKNNKDKLTFNEKIKMIKYGLLDYDSNLNDAGLKNEENNIQKINRIKPLNIIVDKNKNKNDEDISTQFNKLLTKFNENKNANKKQLDDNSYLAFKKSGKENNLNDEINRLNNYIQKNKLNFTYNKMNTKENYKVNSYADLNERLTQLRKKAINNNLMQYMPNNTLNAQKAKSLVLPSNFK